MDSTLYDITTTGALRLLGGRNFTVVANAGNFIDNGQVQLGGGTLAATSLTVGTGATLLGFGTVATGVASTGLVDANGGLLLLSSALTGAGALEADAGATLQLAANTAPTTDSTTITLNGVGSEIEWGDTTPTKIEASLTTISATGTFDVLGSRGYTTTLAITDSGLLQLSGGTFAAASLSVGSGGKLLGYGTITPAVADTGTVEASGTGDVLKLSTGASGAGTLIADNGATLELAGSTTAGAVSDNGTLKLDGITLTATSLTVATGAKLLGFGTVAKGVASTGLVDANGGLLLLSSALTGAGALEADAGATLQLAANTAPTTDSTTITLNGAGSEIEWGSTTPTKIEASLTTISATGTFDVLGSRGYTTTLAITDSGLLQVSGGTFAAASLSVGSGGKLLGYGTITPAVADTGTVEASGTGDVLKLSTGASGAGTLIADSGATLELAGSTTAGAVNDNGTLKLDGITLTATSLTVASGALATGSGTVTSTVTNGGTIDATAGTLKVSGAVSGAGTLLSAVGATLELTGATTAGAVTDSGTLQLDGITLTPASLTVASGALVTGSGTIASAVTNSGTIDATAGTLKVSGAVTGTGSLLINAGQTLELGSSAASTQTAVFASSTGTLSLDAPGSFAGSISGFTGSDEIYLGSQVATGLLYNTSTHVLTVSGSSGTIASLTFNGSYVQANFVLTNGGKDITDPQVRVTPETIGLAPAPTFIDGHAGNDRRATPSASKGLDRIEGFSWTEHDLLDFRAALSATAWNKDLSQGGNFITAQPSAGGASLFADPAGHGHGFVGFSLTSQ